MAMGPAPVTSRDVREGLVAALQLDLVGPDAALGDEREILARMPSRWYLTGYLVPWGSEAVAGAARRDDAAGGEGEDEAGGEDAEVDETVDAPGETGGLDDDATPEPASAQPRHLPSSMGLTVLAPAAARQMEITVSWGDYRRKETPAGGGARTRSRWERTPRRETLTVALGDGGKAEGATRELPVAKSGLALSVVQRPAPAPGLAPGTRAVSIFLVNRRRPAPQDRRDEAYAFQAALEARCEEGWTARPDPRAMASDDWDDRVADLQYRDLGEYAVGHNVATAAIVENGVCRLVRTAWLPQGEVEHVRPREIPAAELGMDVLAELDDPAAARQAMAPLVSEYRKWIAAQRQGLPADARRRETAEELLRDAAQAAGRIETGLALLDDEQVFAAFRVANRAMAAAARQRQAASGDAPAAPRWRPFQLAFLLMNLASLAQPEGAEREIVDLLFFPTGGGKTEAYLGLAAFALVLRRLRHPGPGGAGVTVLMRYTLRLLTLDQLSRAAALVCALELEREKNPSLLGEWPFEIGLWVGSAATPNYMGRQGDRQENTARELTRQFKNDTKRPAPIPLENCPWCGTKFDRNSFWLAPNANFPTDLHVRCADHRCAFSRERHLPIVAVDEPLYRRLPGFVIATVDKFAALPWRGEVGKLFGRVDRCDGEGFFGPCEPGRGQPLPGGMLPPPDLIIQDELHLISGPLGTMAGLYETALDALCRRDGAPRGPKIVASTATVRRAGTQIRALFNRRITTVFPPPGPDRRDNFFAQTAPAAETPPRLYLGVPAQGRGPKVAMLRVYLALLAAGERWYRELRGQGGSNPADPYMTVVGYFNSLRELGGARRLIEDEIRERLEAYGKRKREGESVGQFANRRIKAEPTELTSRVSTADVAEAKRRLALPFTDRAAVDVAIATNMISVGIDIQRLGTMVVFGQPKTSAEYIQASSRIGRDPLRPGLVVTILNVNKPRDRSHYERFGHYHHTFYRAIEASSATPFSPRALDRGLAAALVGLARHKRAELTPPPGAGAMVDLRANEDAGDAFARRAREHAQLDSAEAERLGRLTADRASSLLDCWARVAADLQGNGVRLQYGAEIGAATQLLQDFLSPAIAGLPAHSWQVRFRAPRSLRDVEPAVKLWVQTLAGNDLPPEGA
jgi:hypothetical protein